MSGINELEVKLGILEMKYNQLDDFVEKFAKEAIDKLRWLNERIEILERFEQWERMSWLAGPTSPYRPDGYEVPWRRDVSRETEEKDGPEKDSLDE